MKQLSSIGGVFLYLLVSCAASADDSAGSATPANNATPPSSQLAIGAKAGFGFEWAARNQEAKETIDAIAGDMRNSIGFSGGGWLYVNYWVIPVVAIQGGLGFAAKGSHFAAKDESMDVHVWNKLSYMEFPLGAMLKLAELRLTALLLLEVALTGNTRTKIDDTRNNVKWTETQWDNFRRFNLGLRLGVGYAIPAGPVTIVPGVDWSTQFINVIDTRGNEAMRFMNFFFGVAVEYGLPKR